MKTHNKWIDTLIQETPELENALVEVSGIYWVNSEEFLPAGGDFAIVTRVGYSDIETLNIKFYTYSQGDLEGITLRWYNGGKDISNTYWTLLDTPKTDLTLRIFDVFKPFKCEHGFSLICTECKTLGNLYKAKLSENVEKIVNQNLIRLSPSGLYSPQTKNADDVKKYKDY